MRLIRRVFAAAALLTLPVAAGCASMRSVSVGSDSTDTYAIEVTNTRSYTMTVYWTDGGNAKDLGPVGAGRRERFIIAGASSNTISVGAREAAGTRTAGPYTVTLQAGVTRQVTLR